MYAKGCVIPLALIAALLPCTGTSAVEYKEYKAKRLETEYFEISYNKSEISITTYDDGDAITETFPQSSLSVEDDMVFADGKLLFDDLGMLSGNRHYYYDSIYSTTISEAAKTVSIMFYARKPTASKTSRFKRGNIVAVSKPVTVEEDDFVRGHVLAVAADVEIYGEVNRDVICILGDIYLGPEAVVRGDIAVIDGRVDIADDASIYGEVYDVRKRKIRMRYRFARDLTDWEFINKATYDRCDGLAIYLGVAYNDPDSLLPTLEVHTGYGFNSDRWRYHIGLEQTVLRELPIAVGAAYYRRLANEDAWLLGDHENTAFALLATEDFRDYYEAEGGRLFARTKPIKDLLVETGFLVEETGWLDARRHLWSLFGGSKLFPENFNTVGDDFRSAGISEMDTTQNGTLYAGVVWDTRDEIDPFDLTAWYATADFEWSNPDLSSDFDYRRYVLGIRRYQKVHRRAMVVSRLMFGGSDGYLPMYKRFFLGGLGTLRGYDHKEYFGSRFWLANTEYRIHFPKVETALSVFWDVGQIANDHKLDGSIDIKNNLGVALYIEDDFKISLAKRLDRSFDDNPVFYVRLDHVF